MSSAAETRFHSSLRRRLHDKDVGVRVNAIVALGKIGDEAAIPTVPHC